MSSNHLLRRTVGLFLLLSACLAARAGADLSPTDSPELAALKSAFQSQIEAAKKGVDVRYKERLQDLLKAETQKGDLDGVVAVREELAKIDAPFVMPAPTPFKDSPFAGTIWSRGDRPDLNLEFRADGSWTSVNGSGRHDLGKWRLTMEPALIILENWSPKDPQMPFLLLENGTECMRSIDGYKYQKLVAGQPLPGKPAAPAKPADGGFHPFGTK